jgi:16S rRNA (guanine(966)-N(2))-methyltransferase RsmD
VRVIAEQARGRPLQAPGDASIRPTGDKVDEVKGGISSMLEAEAFRRGFDSEPDDEEGDGRFAAAVAWPRVLELHAGSGALAIEALSRGSAHADLVDSSADARRTIPANLAPTGLADRASVHALTSEATVSTFRGTYDLILRDPPYDAEGVRLVLERLASARLLDRSGVVVWEHGRSTDPPEQIGRPDQGTGLRLLRTRRHGAASVSLYASPDANAADRRTN